MTACGHAREIESRGAVIWRNENQVTKSWTTLDGLPSNQVTALAQTKDGYLWVGTSGGLARFDGLRFVTYGEEDGIPRIPIEKLVALPDGRLWIRNMTSVSHWVENGRFIRDEGRQILDVKEGRDGKIYAYDGEVIFHPDGQKIRTGIPAPEVIHANFAELAVTPDGTIWLLQLDSHTTKVWKWNGTEWKEWRGYEAATGQTLVDWLRMAAAEDGSVWLGSHEQTLYQLLPHGEKVVRIPWVPDRGLHAMMVGRDGTVWAALAGQGLYREKDGKFVPYSLTGGRNMPTVKALLEGNGGEIWAGTTNHGLLRSSRSQVKFHAVDAADNVRVNALIPEKSGEVVVATDGRGLLRWRNGKTVGYTKDEDFNWSNDFTYALLRSSQGTTWVGGSGRLNEFRGSERLTDDMFASQFGISEDSVACLLERRDGEIWAGCFSGKLHRVKGREVRELILPTPTRSAVFDLKEDDEGNVWALTAGDGVVRIAPDLSCRIFGAEAGIPEAGPSVLHRGKTGVMWLGTAGAGLYFLKNGRFHSLQIPGNRELGNVLQIQEDEDGWLWLGTTRGIWGVDMSAAEEGTGPIPEPLWLGAEDGMASEECTRMQAAKDASGRLYFGTMNGFVSFDPREVKQTILLPRAVIEELAVDQAPPIPIVGGFFHREIFPGSRFEVRFTGLPPELAERMRFRYRLSGLESAWVEVGPRRFVDFSSTPPGDYRFEVQAGARNSWSQEMATIDLHVKPFYWQTWWFRSLMISLLTLSVIMIGRMIERRKVRQLLGEIERKRAVNEERERISRDLHDGLGAGLTQVTILAGATGNGRPDGDTHKKLRERLRSLARELDNAVWVTNPSYDRLGPVCDYLAAYAQNWFQGTNVRCILDIPMKLPEIQITAETRHQLVQAVKESLNNIIKHSGAEEVCFSINTAEAALTVVIRDNGRGFDPEEVASRGRHGLKYLQQRLHKIGGKAEILPSPAGTTVEFTVPLSKSA